jgi:thiamine biosynthesis lipoprotein ApbE
VGSVGRSEQIASPVYETEVMHPAGQICITVLGGDAATVEDATARLVELLDRFDPTVPGSDLARVNSAAGEAVACSLETALLVSILDDVSPDGAVIDLNRPAVRVPPDRPLHPGRIAIGLAIDMVAHDLEDAGVIGAMVCVGDDARVVGASPYRDGWTVNLPGRSVRLVEGAAITLSAPEGSLVTGVTITADAAWRAAAVAHDSITRQRFSQPVPRLASRRTQAVTTP